MSKLLLIDTTADSMLVSSTSETVVLPVIARGASFSVYDAGAVSIAERTGASLTAVKSISLLNILPVSYTHLTLPTIYSV